MIPSSLNMPSPSNFRLEAALSFQHADRITVLLRDTWGSSWRPKKQCLICWLDNASNIIQLRDTIKMNDSVRAKFDRLITGFIYQRGLDYFLTNAFRSIKSIAEESTGRSPANNTHGAILHSR